MQKKKIILLESSAYKNHKVPEVPSNRVAALSPATVSILERFQPLRTNGNFQILI